MKECFLAVEAGGTKILVASFDSKGNILQQQRFPAAKRAEALNNLTQFVLGMATTGISIQGVGVASFGPLENGIIQHTPKPDWAGFDWKAYWSNLGDWPVSVDTDVNAAALAEYAHTGKKVPCLGYLTVGTGIGVGWVSNGTIHRGLSHPEAGHQFVKREPDDRFAGVCPFHGDCWEGLASGPAISQRWGQPAEELPGDHPAWDLEARYLARGCLNLFYVFQPEVLILGGGVMSVRGLLDKIRHYLGQYSASYLGPGSRLEDWKRRLQSPGLIDSGLRGAFLLARGEG